MPAPILRLTLLGVALLAAPAALAQNAYCDRLRTDMAALDQAGGGRNQPYADSIRRQQAELDRTVAYARSIGCQQRRFILFGPSGPPQCGQLEAQIDRLQSGLAAVQDQAQRGASQAAGQRAAMAAAYDANCRNPTAAGRPPRQNGLIEQLFGVVPEQDPFEQPEMPDEAPAPFDPLGGGSYKTLCVRKCDGYYFPISPSATRSRFETDASLCQASCPNAEVELYLQPIGQEADAAVSMDGTPYTSLPNAFRYRKAVDSSCTCRRDGQSWVEALAEAERLIGERSQDVVVTEEQAREMSRAPDPAKGKPAAAAKASGAKPGAKGAKPAAVPQAAAAATAPAPPVPTAGSESSGIGGSGTVGDKTLGGNQGETRVVSTPQGKKSVRVVAPTLGPSVQQTE